MDLHQEEIGIQLHYPTKSQQATEVEFYFAKQSINKNLRKVLLSQGSRLPLALILHKTF